MSYINFESYRIKKIERKGRKIARDNILVKAEEKYYSRKATKEKEKWMLQSVEERIKSESIREKKNKHKKKKKKAKRKKSSSSNNSEESEKEDEWIEKEESEENSGNTDTQGKQEVSSVPERDDWMTLTGLLTYEHKKQNRRDEEDQKNKYMLDRLGQSDRELNPYWKDGGTGLPEEKQSKGPILLQNAVGDYGVDWLRRALKRAKEQASSEGRSLEEVAAERWGSLKNLETMLAEAERKSRQESGYRQYDVGQKGRHGRHDRYSDRHNQDEKRSRENEDKDGKYNKSCDTSLSREKYNSSLYTKVYFQKPKDEIYMPRTFLKSEDSELDRSSYLTSGSGNWRKKSSSDSERENRALKHGRYSDRHRRIEDRNRENEDKDDICKFRSGKKNNSSFHTKKYFQKDESYMPRTFLKPEDSEHKANSYKTSGSGNWRQKCSHETEKSCLKCKETSSSDSEVGESMSEEQASTSYILTDKEMNDLGAKLVKAEILGNEELAKQLRNKLEAARVARTLKPSAAVEEEVVVLTRTDSKGVVRPLQQAGTSGGSHKKQKVETHMDGLRVRYFADDDKYSLQDLFEHEKLSSVGDQNEVFVKLAGKVRQGDMDDQFEEIARVKESSSKTEAREKNRAIREHNRVDRVLSNCNWCFDSKEMLKHLIVAIGHKVYLCLPPHQSLIEGHCLIVPMFHIPCATQLDEDVWNEIQTFKKTLVKLFQDKGEDIVFFETAIYLKKFPHMLIECVPLEKEIGDMAPIYFKKAILECETEWATNKKLVDLKGRDVRRAIPKGLPYFTVDFGLDSGFAHVVEDEKMFPRNFAQEIIGGMLDLDHSLWRKQRKQKFDAQRKKVMQFAEWWKPYDFTVKNSLDSD